MRNARNGKTSRSANGDSDNVLTGEPGLWCAVLLRAEADLDGRCESHGNATSTVTYKEIIRRRALAWIESDRDVVGSFVFCCYACGLLPEAVRRVFFKNAGLLDAA